VSQRRTNDRKLHTVAYVGDAAFYCAPENLDAFLFVGFVFFGAGCELFPWFIGFASRGIDMDDMLARRAESFVKNGGDEEGAEILGVLKRTIPVLTSKVKAGRC
jgi:hypothetical protein